MKKLDLTKPVQTRDGRAARIVSTNLHGPEGPRYTIGALVTDANGKEAFHTYMPEGAFGHPQAPSELDLVNVPEKKVLEAWINVYPDGFISDYGSFSVAQAHLDEGGTTVHIKHEYIKGEHQP